MGITDENSLDADWVIAKQSGLKYLAWYYGAANLDRGEYE